MTSESDHWKLPADWEFASIGNKFVFTRKPKGLRLEDYEQVPFIPMDRIPSDRLFFSDFALKPSSDITSGTYFEEGDLLVSKITPCFENGKQGIVRNIPDGFGIATTEVIPLKSIEGVSHLPFLAMYLLHPDIRTRLAGRMEGATGRQRLPKTVLEQWSMPFPPVSEQRAIADVLSKIQAAVEVQDKLVVTLKELKAAAMAKLFREGLRGEPLKQTEIGEIPESWEVIKLGATNFSKTTSGGTPNRSKPEFYGGDIPWVKSGELNDDIIIKTEETITEIGLANSSAKIFPKGTLLLAMYGATAGMTGILGIDAATNQAVCAIFPAHDSFSPEFIRHYLTHVRQRLLAERHGGAQPNISQTLIRNLLVPKPSQEEQEDIAKMLVTISRRIGLANQKRRALKHLFSSMLQLLMTGKIRLPGFGRKPDFDSLWFKPEEVLEFVTRLVRKFDPERVILFGSRAWGTPKRDSDVDLLVVMEFEGRPVDMAVYIGRECDDRFPMDLIVRRPAEVQRRIAMGDPFFKQILRDGLVLHERTA